MITEENKGRGYEGEKYYMKEYIYKYETHCHTKEASRCAENSVSELIDEYVKAGYSGIVITDHFFNGNCKIDDKLNWENRVTEFVMPYKILI